MNMIQPMSVPKDTQEASTMLFTIQKWICDVQPMLTSELIAQGVRKLCQHNQETDLDTLIRTRDALDNEIVTRKHVEATRIYKPAEVETEHTKPVQQELIRSEVTDPKPASEPEETKPLLPFIDDEGVSKDYADLIYSKPSCALAALYSVFDNGCVPKGARVGDLLRNGFINFYDTKGKFNVYTLTRKGVRVSKNAMQYGPKSAKVERELKGFSSEGKTRVDR